MLHWISFPSAPPPPPPASCPLPPPPTTPFLHDLLCQVQQACACLHGVKLCYTGSLLLQSLLPFLHLLHQVQQACGCVCGVKLCYTGSLFTQSLLHGVKLRYHYTKWTFTLISDTDCESKKCMLRVRQMSTQVRAEIHCKTKTITIRFIHPNGK